MEFPDFYEDQKQKVEDVLERILPDRRDSDLVDAMRYSVLNGGKRVRGVLVLEVERAGKSREEPTEAGVLFAAGVELIHAYSLVHDDLPAMDDDDLRRGEPATHVQYGEDLAILAGNGLLNLAYEVVGDIDQSTLRKKALTRISDAAGYDQLLSGQYRDLRYEQSKPAPERVLEMYTRKTGALLGLSLELGAIVGGLTSGQQDTVRSVGVDLGVAFQIRDDLLEEDQSGPIGKSTKSDSDSQKWTYPRLVGNEEAKRKAEELIRQSRRALSETNIETSRLEELADFLIERTY